MLKDHGKQGISFGVMDGIITVLGVIMGLFSTADKKIIVLGALAAGIADAFANAAGIHVSQETRKNHSHEIVIKETIYCFIATVVVMLSLIWPYLFFTLGTSTIIAFIVGVVWLISLGSFVAKISGRSRKRLVAEYIAIGFVISAITYLIGLTFSS